MATQKSGLLLIHKTPGPTSAHVVHRVKQLLGARKIGHLGTLDPFAGGLLLIGINEGTKIADLFLGGDKRYTGVIALGVETDTLDRTGTVVQQNAVPPIDDEGLRRLSEQFHGESEQIPPMFSALKRDGVRLYKLARRGVEVERPPRKIRIDALVLWRLSDAELGFDVSCSGGTYIRTLASDIGRAIGCGAHLKDLTRTACSHLLLEDAITVEALEGLPDPWTSRLLPLASALSYLPEIRWHTERVARLRMGQQSVLRDLAAPSEAATMMRISDDAGGLVALVRWHDGELGEWQLGRVFNEA